MTSQPEATPAASGVAVIDKPAGWTSHQVVGKVRRIAGTRKVGHAGTLDPMATGVLLIGIGKATRLLGHLALTDKAYDGDDPARLATVTDDAEGEVTEAAGAREVTDDQIASALARLRGEHAAGAIFSLGDQDQRRSFVREGAVWSGRDSRSAAGDRGSTGGRRTPGCPDWRPSQLSILMSWSSARPAVTFGRWPETLGSLSERAGTSLRYAGPGLDRSCLTRRKPLTPLPQTSRCSTWLTSLDAASPVSQWIPLR